MLPQEIIDLIFTSCDFEIIAKTRNLQSRYLQIKTKYFTYKGIIDNYTNAENFQHVILNLEWLEYRINLYGYSETENASYTSILYYAARKGCFDIVKYLVKKDVYSYYYDTKCVLLRGAASGGHLEIIKYLIECGANIEANSNSALRISASDGHLEIVKYILEKNPHNINLALQEGAEGGQLEIVKYLVETGANVNHIDYNTNESPLEGAAYYGHLEIVKYLVENGANIHSMNDQALQNSAENGHLEVVKYLVENGADIHIGNESALHHSVIEGHLDVVKYLVERGVDIHFDGDFMLKRSIEFNHLHIVKYLIEEKKAIIYKYIYDYIATTKFRCGDCWKYLNEYLKKLN